MKIKVQIPFKEILSAVKTMSKAEKRKLALALAEENEQYDEDKERFIEMLLNGPVYSEKEIRKIEENT